MSLIESILLGLVQGITEFLPVSSSGHLTLTSLALGVDESQIMTFATMLHMGTLVAVFVVMRREIAALLRKPFSRLTWLLVIGTIPAVAAALLLGDVIEAAFGGAFLGPSFLVTAGILAFNLFFRPGTRTLDDIRDRDAWAAGAAQAFAILPGISRSGTTLTALMGTGVDRESAIRFSFLLSIPAILGGFALDLKTLIQSGEGFGSTSVFTVVAGAAAAAVAGYLVMRFMLKRLNKKGLMICGAYVALLGLFLIADKWFGWVDILG